MVYPMRSRMFGAIEMYLTPASANTLVRPQV